jgi:hypothetical protein
VNMQRQRTLRQRASRQQQQRQQRRRPPPRRRRQQQPAAAAAAARAPSLAMLEEEADVLLEYFVAEDPAGFHSFLSSEWSPSRCDERLAGWLAGWRAGWLPPLSRRRCHAAPGGGRADRLIHHILRTEAVTDEIPLRFYCRV